MIVIMIAGFIFVGLKVADGLSKISTFTDGKSYEDYKEEHPDFVRKGKIFCYHCDTHDIYLNKAGHTPSSQLNSHVCRNCGTELYRSKITL